MSYKEKDLFEKAVESPANLLERATETSGKAIRYVEDARPVLRTRRFWKDLGPGLTTGASDDDPSGIATYSQTGAQYGNQLLWLAGFTFPLMAVVQEMCARIGLTTGRGLAANIRAHYPRWTLYLCTFLLFIANSLNIGADLGAMAKATQLLVPELNFVLLILFFGVASLLMQIFIQYQEYAKYLKYLALILLAYVLTPMTINGFDWAGVFKQAVVPSISWTSDQVILICAILGTTISPYLFFWQTSQEIEEEIAIGKNTLSLRRNPTDQEIKTMRTDIWSGMLLSNIVMFAIIAVCAATLFTQGITEIQTAADAAAALKPLAGDKAYFLFALGIIGTGLLAIPVLAGSAAYAMAESFGWKQGLNYKLKQASAFYGVIIISMMVGFGLNFVGLDPIKALIYSAVANGLIAPVILILIVRLSSNSKIMGNRRNHPFTTIFGWLIVSIMVIAGLATIYSLLT